MLLEQRAHRRTRFPAVADGVGEEVQRETDNDAGDGNSELRHIQEFVSKKWAYFMVCRCERSHREAVRARHRSKLKKSAGCEDTGRTAKVLRRAEKSSAIGRSISSSHPRNSVPLRPFIP